MKKAEEYRQNAKECRDLTRGMEAGEQRDQLLEMAETWERLAEERAHRSRQLASAPHGESDDRHGGGQPTA